MTQPKNIEAAILSSMSEGLLAVDMNGKIIMINKAAAELLSISPPEFAGRTIEKALNNPPLIRFIEKILSGETQHENEITLTGAGGRSIQAKATTLQNGDNHCRGVVVVLNDVTNLRKLENVRRDFVANVSHELKTPITSIKGFVETLLEGAMKKPDEARRFLEIIAKQADRLSAIMEDLLTLSKIESEAENAQIRMEQGRVKGVLQSAIQVCSLKASAKNIRIALNCDGDLSALINSALIEQAVVNLLDNAIKYSDAEKTIKVNAKRFGSEVVISVVDEGSGVDKESLPRLFERFYRVDKARSRKLGGTGLGLAIVKHIATVHKGSVSAESEPGKGSVFSISIPVN